MIDTITRFAWAVLPSIFVAVILAYYNKKQSKKDKAIEDRADMRKKESLLLLKMMFANGKLAYATAMALKRGKANGEVEDAERSYKEAVSAYNNFVNESHVEFLQEDKKK